MSLWGPEPLGGGRTRFRLWAPDAEGVELELRDAAPAAMQRGEGGWFTLEAEAPAGTRYRFRIGDLAIPDPASRAQDGGVHGWSVVAGNDGHEWQARDWQGRPWEESVILELHPGLLGGFAGVARALPRYAELGITAIELMPVAAFSGTRNWGYDGVLPYAPAEAYGTPDDLKALVDRAHALGLSVYLDVVYNHFGPDGNYLGAYASAFFHPEKHTPWGGAVAVDRPEVARFFIDNALMWLGEYRFDGLRFDAVHAIEDDRFLDAMGEAIREGVEPGRHVHLILENERNDAERLAGPYDAQWNDDFHNVVHVLLTGEHDGYYANYAERPAGKLARCLAEGFAYQGDPSPSHDGAPRGKPSGHLPPTSFVNFLQNHDQTGNRAFGERLVTLADPAALRAATALLLLAPAIPMLFMGEEEGARTPFLFFTDFRDELAEAVREGRRGEFAKFPAFSDPASRETIPDPNARETFERSRPEPGPGSDAAEWADLHRELLGLRREHIVSRLVGARSEGAEATGEAAVEARWRMGDGAGLLIRANLGIEPVTWGAAPDAEPLFVTGDAGRGPGCAAWLLRP